MPVRIGFIYKYLEPGEARYEIQLTKNMLLTIRQLYELNYLVTVEIIHLYSCQTDILIISCSFCLSYQRSIISCNIEHCMTRRYLVMMVFSYR